MSNTRKVVIAVVMSYLGTGLSLVSGVVLLPILLAHVGKESYGIYLVVGSFAAYASLFDFGIGYTTQRTVAQNIALNNWEEINASASTAFGFYFTISGLIILLAVLSSSVVGSFIKVSSPESAELARVLFMLSAATVAAALLGNIFSGLMVGLNEIHIANTFGLYNGLISFFGTIILLKLRFGILGYAVFLASVSLGMTLAVAFYLKRKYKNLRVSLWAFDKRKIKSIITPSFYVFLLQINAVVAFSADNLIISSIIGASAVVSYAIAYRVVDQSMRLITTFSTSLFPMTAGYVATGQNDKVEWLHNKTVKLSIALSSFVAVFYGVFADLIIEMWVGKENFVGFETILTFAIWLVMICFFTPTISVLMIKGFEKSFGILGLVGGTLNIITSYFLVKELNVWGTALATLLVTLFNGSFVMFWRKQIFGDSTLRYAKKILLPLIIPICMLIIAALLGKLMINYTAVKHSRFELLALIIGAFLLLGIIYGSLIYLISSDDSEKGLFKEKLKLLTIKLKLS
jgi:O-antigen/teichoic acid export membrane protein